MKELWDQIYHRKKERKGLAIMLLMILAALFFRYYYLNHSIPKHDQYTDLLSKVDFVDLEKDNSTKSSYDKSNSKKKYKPKYTKALRFPFDPNRLSADSFALLGLPKYIGKNIEKYRVKGGKFKEVTDLKKIYGIEKYYDSIADLIKIEKPATPVYPIKKKNSSIKKDTSTVYTSKKEYKYPKEEIPRTVVELNTADSTDLLSLKGIGPFYAKTIIELREKLGGFANAKQLTEAYAVPDTILRTIGSEWIKIDLTKIRKINLNTADFIKLVKHPYLDKKKANAILVYRKVHGDYKKPEDITKIHLISDEDYARLRWYLEV